VFVLLALSMFGFYDLQMPAFMQTRLTEASNRQRGGTLAGVAVMGLLSALIVGPCVAAPLMGALIVIGQTGDALLGGMALFALSMGMGAPLVAIGTGAGKHTAAGRGLDGRRQESLRRAAAGGRDLDAGAHPARGGDMALWAALLILRRSTCGRWTACRSRPAAGRASGKASASSRWSTACCC
jgi:hypothetical protein